MRFIIFFFLMTMLQFSFKESRQNKAAAPFTPLHWQIAAHLPDHANGRPSAGLAGPIVGVSGDHLIIAGGSNFPDKPAWEGGPKAYYRQIYVFKKDAGTISLDAVDHPLELPDPVAYSANASTPQGVVVAGGENGGGALNKVWLLHFADKEDTVQIKHLPDLPLALSGGMLCSLGTTVYFAGGNGKQGTSAGFYSLDLLHPEAGWQSLPDLPAPTAFGTLVGTTQNGGQLYLIGGRRSRNDAPSDLYDGVYCFNKAAGTWARLQSLPYALSAESAVMDSDGRILVFSGDQGKTFHQTELLILKIAAAKDQEEKEQWIRQKNTLQRQHPGFDGVVLGYDIKKDTWQKVDSIPFPGQVTTTALVWDGQIVIPCGEIRAGVRTAAIITGSVPAE